MCGIVGAVAQRNVIPILLEGLRRLEYRGYDSAGLVTINGGLRRVRSVGRVAALAEETRKQGVHGHLGIAHTRWATHGAPTEANAHPHISHDEIAVVHNGIIENHEALREKLKGLGYRFESETDTEVIVHLVHHHYRQSRDLLDAVKAAVRELRGAYAIGVIAKDAPNQLVCARKGSPLIIGLGIEENFIASDASALLPVTQRMIYLEEGDVADIGLLSVHVFDDNGKAVEREVHVSELSADMAELGPYRHYMQKEIHEQPRALADTLQNALLPGGLTPALFGIEAEAVLARVKAVTILACGTSYHAGRVAGYWLESIAGMPANVEIASEYRYRDTIPNPEALVVTISQSGETADTLAALQRAKELGHGYTLAICNVPESSLVRASRLKFLTRAGPEIGVASTKAFTTQLAALYLLTLVLAKLRGKLSGEQEAGQLAALRQLPQLAQEVLKLEPQVEAWARRFANKHHALFLGRGQHYPIALEGALKLKEISYIHAEAYPAGELKHGPLALVDKDMPVVAVAPNDQLLDKLKSNLQEVRARGGELYVFADLDTHISPSDGVQVIQLGSHAGPLSPILHTLPLQLLSYHAALQKGTDVDKPRNLAKSVTVE
ncbi:glutamine--fructose-6-phosphate transaminase (isomerizing) [Betaproteobacteria bacterium SCN2]|jgi:glucosamine--fructose-6-phosphate aminotransferase (isomerizing)|nr:glutamine--fructose-6-phosphate transaminase (isomerizing) [Betaproteobacteria bacterium SCN2]